MPAVSSSALVVGHSLVVPERLADENGAIVQVADAIRLAYARQRDALDGTTDWRYLVTSSKLQWLELAYAAVSAWTASDIT